MELSRPKTKRKQTSKPRPIVVQPLNAAAVVASDATASSSLQSLSDLDVDIDFPTTPAAVSTSGEDVSTTTTPLPCPAEQSQLLEEAIDDDGSAATAETTQTADEAEAAIIDENCDEAAVDDLEATAPCDAPPAEETILLSASAPPICEPSTPMLITYPNLQQMQRDLHALPDIEAQQIGQHQQRSDYAETVVVRPFTVAQMRDLFNATDELSAASAFEEHFIFAELNADYRRHPLHDLLTKYARCRQTLRHNRLDVAAVAAEVEQLQPRLWRRERRTVRYQATCADGALVHGSEEYEFASVDESVFERVATQLSHQLNLVSYHCALNLYLAETHRLQITQHVQQLQRLPIDRAPAETAEAVRTAISILFHFVRRSLPDQQLVDDMRQWLRQLVAHLLARTPPNGADVRSPSSSSSSSSSFWPDRLLLTLHVLRCPAGVAEWAASFVQLPLPPAMPHNDAVAAAAPFDPFASRELHQCIAYLRTLLRPVVARTDFLRQNERRRRARHASETQPLDPVKEDVWTLIDSDGDDETAAAAAAAAAGSGTALALDAQCGPGEVLKENDLIALLNQLPMERLFGACTLAQRSQQTDGYRIDADRLHATHVLRLIAFANALVQLLGDGLHTYTTERYRQFAKRLGRLIRHTVVYVAETFALFRRGVGGGGTAGLSAETRARIAVEFDVFVLRAADYIYRSRCLGAWQYLAVLPFAELRIATVWQLYYFLGAGGPAGCIDGHGEGDDDTQQRRPRDTAGDDDTIVWQRKARDASFLRLFADACVDVPAEDRYYLLQTFAALALARRPDRPADRQLIEAVLIDLLDIGFVQRVTAETSYKQVRDLLVGLVEQTPDLIGVLLAATKQRFRAIERCTAEVGSNTGSVYLFKALPLQRWRPAEADLEIPAAWLLHGPCDSAESALARTILSRLNWGFDATATGTDDEQLHLAHDVHVRMACLLCEASARHVPDAVVGGRAGITESVRQAAQLVKGAASPAQQFATWCWNMVTVLRLHGMDGGREQRARLLHAPAQAMHAHPAVERLAAVHQGCSEGRPLALYVAVLATQCGHSVPLVCQRGFGRMAALLQDHRQSAVVRALELVTPLFVECAESLAKCEGFQSILTALLNADKTYMKMAKDLIANDYPGPVCEQLGQMIQSQFVSHHAYAFATPLPLVQLWLEALCSAAAWQRCSNAVYLVNVVLQCAWQLPAMWHWAKEFFRARCTDGSDAATPKLVTQRVGVSLLPAFLGGGGSGGSTDTVGTLAALPAVSAPTAWMSVLTLELEHELLELQSGVWPELLRQLQATPAGNKPTTLDAALKSAAAAVHCRSPPPTSANLVLYRWANLMLSTPVDHALLPIMAQRFFELYLARVPLASDEQRLAAAFGVADRFYEHHLALMKRLKRHLAAAEAALKAAALRCDGDVAAEAATAAFRSQCSRLFGTFGLWLEETRLNQLSGGALQWAEFPPQYETARLARMFAGEHAYWMDLVALAEQRAQQRAEAARWQQQCYRLPPATPTTAAKRSGDRAAEPHDPHAQLVRQLGSYDAPVAAPAAATERPILPPVVDTHQLLQLLRTDLAALQRTASAFHTTVQELQFTDCNYKDLVRVLYANRAQQWTRTLRCSSLLASTAACRGGRDVQINVTEPCVDGRIQSKIERNREKHQLCVERQTAAPPTEVVLVFVRLQHYVRYVLARYGQLQQQLPFRPDLQADLCAMTAVGTAFFYDLVNGMGGAGGGGEELVDAFPPAHELLGEMLGQLGELIRDQQSAEGVRLLRTALRQPQMVQLLADVLAPSATAPVYFLEMYQFVVDSHMKKCDPKILFVLLSKFDVAKWLVTFMPKLVDIGQLLRIIVQGLESWNQPDAALIQGLLRRHLVHIFQYDFPEHYGECLQTVLAGCSDQRLLPSVLGELLQAIYQLAQCAEPPGADALQAAPLRPPMNNDDSNGPSSSPAAAHFALLDACVAQFAERQQLFGYPVVLDTLRLLAQHFRTERLQHGLHGLYPKHRDACGVLAALMRSYAQALVVTAVCAYPGLLADKLLDWLWPALCDTFAPWLVPYHPHQLNAAAGAPSASQPANWIRQVLASDANALLLPWSELYAREAQHMAEAFAASLRYVLDTLPGSDALLGHVFHWYEAHLAHVAVPRHVRQPLHAALSRLLPWQRFRPQPVHVGCIHRALGRFLPESHAFMGHVWVRVDWSEWFAALQQQQQLNSDGLWPSIGGPTAERSGQMEELLLVFVKLAMEPNGREERNGGAQALVRMLREAAGWPGWSTSAAVSVEALRQVMDAVVLMADPAIVLTTLNAERHHEAVDTALLNILQLACCMQCTAATPYSSDPSTVAKRALYVKTIVRLLRLCGTKNQQLLSAAEGVQAFRAAVRRLLDAIDALAGGGGDAHATPTAFVASSSIPEAETIELMDEVVGSMQLPGEFTSKIFADAIVQWQSQRDRPTALIPATLNAIGSCRTFTRNVIALLEATLFHYFRLADNHDNDVGTGAATPASAASWSAVTERLGATVPGVVEGTELVQRQHLLTLHVFTVYKLRALRANVGEQLTLLQRLHLILEDYKTCEADEPKLLALWSLMIAFGVQRWRCSDNAKTLLLTLGRFLQTVSAHADGWGDGVLGALGLRRDAVSKRRRLATRCLACVVFSLFPDVSNPHEPCKEYAQAIDELIVHVHSKRYADVRSLGQRAVELVQTQHTAAAAVSSGSAFEAQTVQTIVSLLRLFYKEAAFLGTLEGVWRFGGDSDIGGLMFSVGR